MVVAAAGFALLPAAAQAAPASGVTGTILARDTMADHFQLTADHATEFVVRHITIQPGSTTGWHYYPGSSQQSWERVRVPGRRAGRE